MAKPMIFPPRLALKTEVRKKEGAWRTLGVPKGMVDFASNDYLGLARSEALFAKTFQLLLQHNIAENGATGSRLLTGNHKLYDIVEYQLAKAHLAEKALIFNSGYDANMAFFATVPQKDDIVFYDALVHASIRDGMRMGPADHYKFAHNDVADLAAVAKRVLQKRPKDEHRVCYVVTESVFSMDGDGPELKTLSALCRKMGFYLVVDEAHALGYLGADGLGLMQDNGQHAHAFARIVTFGKAMGCQGAAILGPTALYTYLLNFARNFIYTTGLTPHTLATISAAYTYLETNGAALRDQLAQNILFFRKRLKELNLEVLFIPSGSAIQSCIIPGNEKVLKVAANMQDKGFYLKAVRSPTVPEGQERIRFCLKSTHSQEEMGLALQLLSKQL